MTTLGLLLSCGTNPCNSSTCSGCCDATGICRDIAPTTCGRNGSTCHSCIAGQLCVMGACTMASGGSGGSTGTGGGSSSVGGGTATGGSGGGSNPFDNCAAEARLVYLVDNANTFLSFEPTKLAMGNAFTTLGTLACPARSGAQPFSMAIDRNAIAWVNFDDGELFKVDIKNGLACTQSGFAPQQNISVFGMGFVSNAAMSMDETLFISGSPSSSSITNAKLATLSVPTPNTLRVITTLQGAPELTGTGDAKLWAFFPDVTTPHVSELNKSSGAISRNFNLTSLAGAPRAWAFAFWGGDFWIFLKKGSESASSVYRMNGTTGQITQQAAIPGRSIVGAGVSTCAPLMIQ